MKHLKLILIRLGMQKMFWKKEKINLEEFILLLNIRKGLKNTIMLQIQKQNLREKDTIIQAREKKNNFNLHKNTIPMKNLNKNKLLLKN